MLGNKYTRLVSKCAECGSRLYIPVSMRDFIYKSFANSYNVDLDDIKNDIKTFNNFNEFFTREVKERKIDCNNNALICPADSKILEIDEIVSDKVLLIKDKKYSFSELLGHSDTPYTKDSINNIKNNKDSKLYSVIFYLSPKDYHRFHSPHDITISKVNHIPGYLYPVKEDYIYNNDKVYEKNERVAIFGNYKYGILGYVAVGALNVGSISLSFAKDITTNNYNKQLHTNNIYRYNNLQLKKGDELGRFNLGSTIVMIFEAPKSFKFTKQTNDIVRYGDILGVVE